MCNTKTVNSTRLHKGEVRVEKNNSKKASKRPSMQASSAAVCSDVHTTGTFEQFWGNKMTDFKNKNGFITASNRYNNLDIVRALEGCKFKRNPQIKNLIKGLSCCSSMGLVESKNGEARLVQTSKKCRRKICPICNRIKSAKYVNRFVAAYNSPLGWELFQKKYFSLITLTLKHNRVNLRRNVYLKELKTYLKKLQRSKIWKKHFPYSKSDPLSGWANCFELTISDNGFHIHVHILVCAPKYKEKITCIQDDFRAKWKSITGDSTGCVIDLIKLDKASKRAMREGNTNCDFMKAILEVFKYSVKVGNSKELAKNIDDLAEFVIETKGQNMVVAGGFFRGLQLFGKKSIWDEVKEEGESTFEIDDDSEYFVGRTIDIEYSKEPNNIDLKPLKKKALDNVYLRGIYVTEPEIMKEQILKVTRDNIDRKVLYPHSKGDYSNFPRTFLDVTTCISAFSKYFSMSVFDGDFKNLPDWVLYCIERSCTASKAIDRTESDSLNEQMELFGEKNENLSENEKLHLEYW